MSKANIDNKQCEKVLTNPNLRPRVISPWRVRNDIKNLIAYKCVPTEIKYKILSQAEALIVPFLNGQNTIQDVYQSWLYINSANKHDVQKLTDIFCQTMHLLLISDFVAESGDVSPTYLSDISLVPCFESYHFPAFRLEMPISVSLEITNNCRTDCIYCYAERLPCNEMNLKQIKKIMSDLSKNEIYIVEVGGADIFTREDALLILEEMVERQFVFFLSTKCFITEENAKKLADLGIGTRYSAPHLMRLFQISIDSADSETASFLVRRKNYLEDTVLSVKNCISAGIHPKIKCVLTRHNAVAAKGLVEKFYPLGVTEFQFVQYGRSFYRHDDALFLTIEDKVRLIKTAALLREEYPQLSFTFQEEMSAGLPARRSTDEWQNRSLCSGGRACMLVKPNGDVLLCEQIPHRVEFVIGNLTNSSVSEIWHSENLKNFIYPPRKMFANTVCEHCAEFDKCHLEHGYCFRDSLSNFNSIFDAPSDCPYQTKDGIRQI